MAEYYRVFPRSGSAEPEELRSKKPFRGAPPVYNPRRHRRRSSCCCRCCCCLCFSIAALLLLLFIAASIIYIILNPKAPNFSITRAYITEFNITAKPIENAGTAKQPTFYLQTDMNFTVQVKNPNKKVGIFFQHIDVGLGYQDLSVGRGALPSFYVGVKESKEMELQVKGQDTLLTEEVGLSLQKAMAPDSKNSTLWVQVETVARARMRVWGHESLSVAKWR